MSAVAIVALAIGVPILGIASYVMMKKDNKANITSLDYARETNPENKSLMDYSNKLREEAGEGDYDDVTTRTFTQMTAGKSKKNKRKNKKNKKTKRRNNKKNK